MVRRRRKQRQQFSCNHRGFGRFCHRCREIAPQPHLQGSQLTPAFSIDEGIYRPKKLVPQLTAKQQWQQAFADDPINLRHLPKPIVLKARRILKSLDQGVAPAHWQGKRFNFDRTLLRIPVSYRYRLLCRWQAGRIIPLQVLSHESYNAIARNKKRLNG